MKALSTFVSTRTFGRVTPDQTITVCIVDPESTMTGAVAAGPQIGAHGAADTLRVFIEMRAMSRIDERKRIKITLKKYENSIWKLL